MQIHTNIRGENMQRHTDIHGENMQKILTIWKNYANINQRGDINAKKKNWKRINRMEK